MENWMNEIGVITNIYDLGVTKDDIENIADLTLTMDGGYKTLSRDEKSRCCLIAYNIDKIRIHYAIL